MACPRVKQVPLPVMQISMYVITARCVVGDVVAPQLAAPPPPVAAPEKMLGRGPCAIPTETTALTGHHASTVMVVSGATGGVAALARMRMGAAVTAVHPKQ